MKLTMKEGKYDEENNIDYFVDFVIWNWICK